MTTAAPSADARNELEGLVAGINQWKRRGVRAPHKPLLLLYALARAERQEPRLVRFDVAEDPLRRLLIHFSNPRRSPSPSYPFWYLRNDGLWEVEAAGDLPRRAGSTEPQLPALRERGRGGLLPWIHDLVVRDAHLRRRLVAKILAHHFPQSLHADICAELGISVGSPRPARRDARFREQVLRAYQGRCAVCGFDVRLGHQSFGVEAAHMMWWQAGGPCTVPNGLALCALHHRALDRGAIAVADDWTILVSTDLSGDPDNLQRVFYTYAGTRMRPPQNRTDQLDPEFARWHREQVFRAPARVG